MCSIYIEHVYIEHVYIGGFGLLYQYVVYLDYLLIFMQTERVYFSVVGCFLNLVLLNDFLYVVLCDRGSCGGRFTFS